MQRHTLSVTRIQSHEGFTAHELCWPARKSIPKLEHRIGSDRVEVVITVDKACQALPNDVKERIERGKRSIGGVTHRSTPVFGTPTLTARAVSSCQHPPRCNSGRGTQRTWVIHSRDIRNVCQLAWARRRHMGLRWRLCAGTKCQILTTSSARRKETQRRFNMDPAKDPLRILLATDAAREGLNFQAHCADLFHFDTYALGRSNPSVQLARRKKIFQIEY